jgi:hypothetical protein
VKCPFSARSSPLAQLAGPKYFLKFESDGKTLQLNLQHDIGLKYYHQVQGNLALTGRSVCDFVVWTPLECIVLTIHADPSWKNYLQGLYKFYVTYFLPAFLQGGVDA